MQEEVKAKAELTTACQYVDDVPPYVHIAPQQRLGFLKHLQTFNNISIQPLADH